MSEIKKIDSELSESIERINIHDFYNEKLLIFNYKKELIYSSIDDTPIENPKDILDQLSIENEWYEDKDQLYDVVGLYFQNKNKAYYGISKAYDKFGHQKLDYLKDILIAFFIIISFAVISISYFLSQKITQPLISITQKIKDYHFEKEYKPIVFEQSKNEIAILAQRFNELMNKIAEAFAFQKHAIHHISHELKTPISILVSNFEKIEKETDIEKIHLMIKMQKEGTKNLSEIITLLLEIAKYENGNIYKEDNIRIDELIFDAAEDIKVVYPDFIFSIDYTQIVDENHLTLSANAKLLKAAFTNLILNCIQYSEDKKVKVSIRNDNKFIEVSFENKGAVINEKEKQFLFQHFFRGENSKGKRGFGLGLVFVHKIIVLHNGYITYHTPNNNTNLFIISLPLS